MRSIGLALLAVLVLAGACMPEEVLAPSPLTRVLQLVPMDLDPLTIGFTDWLAIKRALDVPDLTSSSPLEDRIAFALDTDGDHALGSAFGLSKLSTHAETWGFDSTDLEWEAQILGAALPSIYILKLRDDFEVGPLDARFLGRGFVQTASFGAILYARNVDPSADWLRSSELAIHTTAVLKDEKLLILSSSFPAVRLVLATQSGEVRSLAESLAATTLFEQLDGSYGAYMMLGRSTCLRFSPNPLLDRIGATPDDSALDALRAWFASGDPLRAYEALGTGYVHDEGVPIGTIAFVYTDADDAMDDLEPRQLLATNGASSLTEKPIAETYFAVTDATVDETVLQFTVSPTNDQPRRLFQMLIYADAPFAACR